jgi:hypothetical protein
VKVIKASMPLMFMHRACNGKANCAQRSDDLSNAHSKEYVEVSSILKRPFKGFCSLFVVLARR